MHTRVAPKIEDSGGKFHYLLEIHPGQDRLAARQTPSVSHTRSCTQKTYINMNTRVDPTIEDSGGKVPLLT